MVPLIGHVNIMRYACIQSRRINFLIIPDTAVECQLAYQALIELLSELGFQINWDKAVEPCQRLTFLGIDIDNANSANYDWYLAKQLQSGLSQNGT